MKNKAGNIKELTNFVKEPLRLEAKHLIDEIRSISKDVDYRKLRIRDSSNVTYDFSDYKTFN